MKNIGWSKKGRAFTYEEFLDSKLLKNDFGKKAYMMYLHQVAHLIREFDDGEFTNDI